MVVRRHDLDAGAAGAGAAATHGFALWHDGAGVWLFGGVLGSGQEANDLWRWDGQDWLPVATTTSPSPRRGVVAAYDQGRQRAVLFGGEQSGLLLADTWEFDGVDWLLRTPPVAPGPRAFAAMAHDPQRGITVLCHGHRTLGGGFLHTDSWQWDGQQWTRLASSPPYSPWAQQSMAFVPSAGGVVFCGLYFGAIETWTFDGVTWSLAPGPIYFPFGFGPAASADAAGNLVLHAGGQLFRRSVTAPAAAAFGSGCGTMPELAARTDPALGERRCAIEVTGVPRNAMVALLAADTAIAWPLGSGCTQLVPHTQTVLFLLADPRGMATLPLPVPADPALRGLVFQAQAATLTPVPPGFALSAGLRLQVGD